LKIGSDQYIPNISRKLGGNADINLTVTGSDLLAAGLSGGLIGDSSADAVSAAQSGKTTVENNLMAGNEQSHAKFVQEHGKDVLSCSDNPTSASCQRGEAVIKRLLARWQREAWHL
jgi:hypothetical protein